VKWRERRLKKTVFEFYVLNFYTGLMFFCTLLSGVNHTLQTSLTAALALDVDVIGNLLDRYENYFVLFCTFLGGAIPIIFMGVPRFWSHIKSTSIWSQ
jgi:hypothetical protein